MIKAEIYPEKGLNVADFEAIPVVKEILGWVNGDKLIERPVYAHDLIDPAFSGGFMKLPCLMAVVEIDDEIQQVEHYRIKILKED